MFDPMFRWTDAVRAWFLTKCTLPWRIAERRGLDLQANEVKDLPLKMRK